MEELTLRPLGIEDAEAVAALSEDFGYPATADRVRSRLEALMGSKDRLALCAVMRNVVVGWIDAALEQHLQSEPVVTIGGLVVREDMRGNEIGHQLCLAVEAWAARINVKTVRVRSQQKRTDAHRFYGRDGYKQVKISVVLEKQISLHS